MSRGECWRSQTSWRCGAANHGPHRATCACGGTTTQLFCSHTYIFRGARTGGYDGLYWRNFNWRNYVLYCYSHRSLTRGVRTSAGSSSPNRT